MKQHYLLLVNMLVPSIKLGALIEKINCTVSPSVMTDFADWCVSNATDDADLTKVRKAAEVAWICWHH